jgi:metal-responsive CopG/Arc/MetJ family transcriptional regulator
MHVHLEFEKCLEIIAVSGPYKRVRKLKDDLQRLKSVLSIGFFIIDRETTNK